MAPLTTFGMIESRNIASMAQDSLLSEASKPNRARRLVQALLWLAVIFLFITLVLFVGLCGCTQEDQVKITTAEAQMNTLKLALSFYNKEHGYLPSTEEGLQALVRRPGKTSVQKPLIAPSGILDPWGSAYQYHMPDQDSSRAFDLWSCGPDKKDKTEDDIQGLMSQPRMK